MRQKYNKFSYSATFFSEIFLIVSFSFYYGALLIPNRYLRKYYFWKKNIIFAAKIL